MGSRGPTNRLFPFTFEAVRFLLSDPAAMASSKNVLRTYKVEFAPAAWTQVAHLPREAYFTLQERMRVLAEQAGVGRLSAGQSADGPGAGLASFTFGDYIARYQVDEMRELVRLMEVTRAPRTASSTPPRGTTPATK